MLDAFYTVNEGAHIFDHINTTESRWGKMANILGRTCMEGITADGAVSPEYNHAWTASPGGYFLKHIVGITPTSAGFATFDVRPVIGGRALTYASGTVPTVKGEITVSWKKDDAHGERTLRVKIPVNATAIVCIPKDGYTNERIEEGGTVIWEKNARKNAVSGIGCDGIERDFVRFRVGSGSYSFRLAGTPRGSP